MVATRVLGVTSHPRCRYPYPEVRYTVGASRGEGVGIHTAPLTRKVTKLVRRSRDTCERLACQTAILARESTRSHALAHSREGTVGTEMCSDWLCA